VWVRQTACEDELKHEVKSKKCERNHLPKNEMNQIEAKEAKLLKKVKAV
jgi:hypothetical protein